MGILDKIFKKEESPAPKEEKAPRGPEKEEVSPNVCSGCNQPGADKRFSGMFWHKSCLRSVRKQAKKML